MTTRGSSYAPDDFVEGGGIFGKDGTIIRARFKVHDWVRADGTPVLVQSGPQTGQQSRSTVLALTIQPDGEDEAVEQLYPVANPQYTVPGVPDLQNPAGDLLPATESVFLKGSPHKTQPGYMLITELLNAPGPGGIRYPLEKLTTDASKDFEGLYCHWEGKIHKNRGGNEHNYPVPTIVHRFPWEAQVAGNAQGTAPAPSAPAPAAAQAPAAPQAPAQPTPPPAAPPAPVPPPETPQTPTPPATGTNQDEEFNQIGLALVQELLNGSDSGALSNVLVAANQQHSGNMALVTYLGSPGFCDFLDQHGYQVDRENQFTITATG